MENIFEKLRETALERTNGFEGEEYVTRGVWRTELVFKPNPSERAFNYTFLLAMVMGQGCCYCSSNMEIGHEMVGKPAAELVQDMDCLGIAVLDAVYSGFKKNPAKSFRIEGNPVEKTLHRNTIIADEIERLCECPERENIHILNVGVVGDLVQKLRMRNFRITATDLDPGIVGACFHGIKIEHGAHTLELIRKSDLAVITGMTIATNTLGEIISLAKDSDTKLVIFAETGANFGEEYCTQFGVDAVVSEPYPFYIFQGTSTIDIYRSEQGD